MTARDIALVGLRDQLDRAVLAAGVEPAADGRRDEAGDLDAGRLFREPGLRIFGQRFCSGVHFRARLLGGGHRRGVHAGRLDARLCVLAHDVGLERLLTQPGIVLALELVQLVVRVVVDVERAARDVLVGGGLGLLGGAEVDLGGLALAAKALLGPVDEAALDRRLRLSDGRGKRRDRNDCRRWRGDIDRRRHRLGHRRCRVGVRRKPRSRTVEPDRLRRHWRRRHARRVELGRAARERHRVRLLRWRRGRDQPRWLGPDRPVRGRAGALEVERRVRVVGVERHMATFPAPRRRDRQRGRGTCRTCSGPSAG